MTQVQKIEEFQNRELLASVSRRIFVALLLTLFCKSPLYITLAFADEYEASEARLSNAYNEYYQAIRSGRAQNKKDVMRLQEEIISPAAGAVSKALAEKEQKAIMKNIGKTITPAEAKAMQSQSHGFEDMDPLEARAEAQKMVEEQNREYAKAAGAPASVAGEFELQEQKGGKKVQIKAGTESKKSKREDVVLDGKEVEKEIAFPGAKKSGRLPAAKAQVK